MARGVSSKSQLPVIYGLVIASAVQGLQVPLTLLGTGIDPHPLLQLPECLINGNQLVHRRLTYLNELWTLDNFPAPLSQIDPLIRQLWAARLTDRQIIVELHKSIDTEHYGIG